MRQLITEIFRGLALGFYHSLRGFYRWYAYDQPKAVLKSYTPRKDGSDIGESPHQLLYQPLTSLARKRLDSQDLQEPLAPESTKQKAMLKEVLLLTFSYNLLLVLGYVLWAILQVLPYRLVSPDYHSFCYALGELIQFFLFLSRLLFAKIINIRLQSDAATYVCQQALGRTRSSTYASSGSDFYASLQLQVLYYILLSLASVVLAWFGVIGYAVSVFISAPYWSLYSFDYCWYYMSVPFQDRLTYIEQNWPYFVGFGLPLAFVDIILPSLWGSALPLFMLPFVMVSAVDATALGNKEQIFSGSSLHFFSPAIWLSDQLHGGCIDVPQLIQYCIHRVLVGPIPPLLAPPCPTSADSSSQASTPVHHSTRDLSRASGSSVRRSVTPELGNAKRADSRRSSDVRRPSDHSALPRCADSEETPALSSRAHAPSQVKVASWLQDSMSETSSNPLQPIKRSLQFTDTPPPRYGSGPPVRPPPSLSSTLTAATAAPAARRRNFRSNIDQTLC